MREIATLLKELGHDIRYKERTDGSIRVTMIDGVRFKSNESLGNTKAREILGAKISEARIKQLKKISIKKGTKRDFVSEETREKIKQINENLKAREKSLKKKGAKKVSLGRIRLKNYRADRKEYGEQHSEEALDRALRYSKGLAYIETLQAIIARLRQDGDKLPPEEKALFDEIANSLQAIIDSGANNFDNEYLQHIIEWIYEREKGSITTKEMVRRIKPWINAGR